VRTWRIAPALLLACSARSASRTPVERPDAAVEQAEVGSDLAEDIGDDSGNDLGNDAGGDLGNDLGNDLENQEAGSADVSDGGGDGARDGARDLSRCIPIGPPPREFALTKLTEAQQFYVPPSIQIGGDGTVRVIFLDRGAPDSEDLTLWAAVLAPPAGAAAAPEVHLVKLASSLHSTASPRVAVTRTGELRMVYLGWSLAHETSVAHYLTWSGDWQSQPVDTVVSSLLTTAPPAIVLDRDDRPILGLVYFNDRSMRLLTPATGGWVSELVDVGVDPSAVMSIAIDSGESTFVAAVVPPMNERRFSPLVPGLSGINVWTRVGTEWWREVLDRFGTYPRVRAVRTPTGATSIVGWETYYGLSQMYRFSVDWNVTVPQADGAGTHLTGDGDVVLGPGSDAIHAGYSPSSGGTHYAVHDRCLWSQVLVDPAGGVPAITLDTAGRPHLAYERLLPGGAFEVMYAAPR